MIVGVDDAADTKIPPMIPLPILMAFPVADSCFGENSGLAVKDTESTPYGTVKSALV